jgi:hypothetical protein
MITKINPEIFEQEETPKVFCVTVELFPEE